MFGLDVFAKTLETFVPHLEISSPRDNNEGPGAGEPMIDRIGLPRAEEPPTPHDTASDHHKLRIEGTGHPAAKRMRFPRP